MGGKSSNGALREYSAEARHAAVALAERVGVAAAARELGIPKGTLGCWRFLASQGKLPGVSASALGAAEPIAEAVVEKPVMPPVVEKAAAVPEAPSASVPMVSKGKPAKPVAKIYTPSQRAQALERVAAVGQTAASKELGISRFTLYEWQRKVRLHAEGKASDSPVVGPDAAPAVERDRRILEVWKQHPGLGPTQIRNQLRRAGLKVSVHTTRRVMEEHGYRPPKVRREKNHDGRYEAVRPNHLWHLDFLHRFINQQKIYVLIIIDDFSRFIVGAGLWDGEKSDAVIETFDAAVTRHGRPETLMSDGGSAFWSWRGTSRFTRLLEELGVDQLVATTPELNGKSEVLNANLQKELFNPDRFFDLGETQHRLDGWVEFYNLRRTHLGLGGLLVPGDRYFGRAARVLAEIEAGRPGDGVAQLVSADVRQLDLLRVTSKGGQVEMFLMGQRLWPPVVSR